MDRDPVEPCPRQAALQAPELARASDRVDAPNRNIGEWLEQSPPAGTDSEAPLWEVRPDRVQNAPAQLRPGAFEVEQELGLGSRGGKEVVQQQSRAPGGGELPAIPEDGERPDRLEMPHLEPATVEADVRLDEGDSELLGRLQVKESVSGAVRDEERAAPVSVRRQGGLPTHCQRV